MRKPRRLSFASAGPMASRSARIAHARPCMIAARRTVLRAGAARHAARVSASRLARFSRSTRCHSATYLAAIANFCNEVKGKSALALSRDLDCQYKTACVLAHKLREAMASELKGLRLGGDPGGSRHGWPALRTHRNIHRPLRPFRHHDSNDPGDRCAVADRYGDHRRDDDRPRHQQ
jgi:hypothetical protein